MKYDVKKAFLETKENEQDILSISIQQATAEQFALDKIMNAFSLKSRYIYDELAKWVDDYGDEIINNVQAKSFHRAVYLYRGLTLFYCDQDLEGAIDYCEKALATSNIMKYAFLDEILSDRMIYKEMGTIFRKADLVDDALLAYRRAFELIQQEQLVSVETYVDIAYNMAVLHSDLEEFDVAEQLVNDAFEMNEQESSLHMHDYLHHLRAGLFMQSRNIKKCEEHLNIAKIFAEANDTKGLLPYIHAMELRLELNKAGIWSHEDRPLIDYDRGEIAAIHGFYMAQPAVVDSLIQYILDEANQTVLKIMNRKPLTV